MVRQDYMNDTGSSSGLLFVLAIFALVTIGIGYLCLRPDGIDVIEGEHAVQAHGEEAEAIRKCLNDNGPNSTWQFMPGKKADHYIFCTKMDDGRWGIQIAQRTKAGKWLEKTSFVVKDGRLNQLIEYVTARAIEIAGGL